jgi:hypothetical protein
MRFVVDLYRYLLLALCAGVLILMCVAIFAALDPAGPMQGEYSKPVLIGALMLGILFIINMGLLATVISLHDRHAEIADRSGEIAYALEQIAASSSNWGRGDA